MKKTTIYFAILMIAFAFNSAYSGCPVPGIEVSLKNTTTNKTYKTKTNKKGKYSFKRLAAGTYVLTLSYKGKSMSVGDKGRDKLVISSPRDAASGLPTGKRQHKPITITKELDKSSPLLAAAIVDNYIRKKPGRVTKSSSSNKSKAQDYNSSRSNRRGVNADYLDDDDDDDGLSERRRKKTPKRASTKSSKRGNGIDNDCDDIGDDKASPVLVIVVKKNEFRGHVTVLK